MDGKVANKKRIYRLMREHNLTVKQNQSLRAKKLPERSKPKPVCPKQWRAIDMTKVMTDIV